MALLAVTMLVPRAQAQRSPRAVRVSGVVLDSVRSTRLTGALVAIPALHRQTTTDSLGHFSFADVPQERLEFVVLHEALDTLGLSALRTTVDVSPAMGDLTLATPSLGTIWRRFCAQRPHGDSGIVVGTVSDLAGAPVAGAQVSVTWVEFDPAGTRDIAARRLGGAARTDANGRYLACGVSKDWGFAVQARIGSVATDVLDVPADEYPVHRIDLVVPLGAVSDARGTVVGLVHDDRGNPLRGVRVSAEAEVATTDAAGHFRLAGVPVGTRQLTITAIGKRPDHVPAVARPDTVTDLDIPLAAAVQVPAIRTVASRALADLEARQATPVNAQFLDSTRLFAWQNKRVRDVVNDLMTNKARCFFPMLDGEATSRANMVQALDLWVTDVAVLEIHGTNELPDQYKPRSCHGEFDTYVILIWTKAWIRKMTAAAQAPRR